MWLRNIKKWLLYACNDINDRNERVFKNHKLQEEASRADIRLAELEQPELKKMLSFCSGRVPIYVHPCFYRSLKLKYPSRFSAILLTSPTLERPKRLAARGWLLNTKSMMRWSRSASTNRQDQMVYPTKCTWGCCTCLCIFWKICSTIGSPREPSLVALPKAWSHCWRKVACMFARD